MKNNRNYLKISELCEEYHKSRTTVTNYVNEIDKEHRYKDAWIYLEPGASTRQVNRNVFEDYLHYRAWLSDRNLRKHVPPFDPDVVVKQRGEKAPEPNEPKPQKLDKETVKTLLREILKEGIGA